MHHIHGAEDDECDKTKSGRGNPKECPWTGFKITNGD